MNYQLSILIPSAYPEKLAKLIANLRATMTNFDNTEIVICRDGNLATHRDRNFVHCYSPPTKYRSTFHEKPWLESSGRFLMMANDDIEFETKNWDLMIPYNDYPDDLVLFHFRDDVFNDQFACHPIFSRKMMNLVPGILSPLYNITKCDNTIWDCHPPNRRIYLPNIKLVHHHEEYGKQWQSAYEEDNITYINNTPPRNIVRAKIWEEIGMAQHKVMFAIPTGEMARRADFYDHFQLIDKPKNSICIFSHGQSVAFGRNQMIKQAIAYDCTHVLFLDDDVICKPDILFRLLKHDKDIVTALQLRRDFPHQPYIFTKYMGKGIFKYYEMSDDEHGLIPIAGAGFGCVLIKIEVFKKMQEPWLRFGEYEKDQLGEDLGFFVRAGELGIRSYCDLDAQIGHIASVVIRPVVMNNKNWHVSYDTGGKGAVSFTMVKNVVAETV